jgi:ubiquinone/menaquinone biosynthesis C-methylase UbiE
MRNHTNHGYDRLADRYRFFETLMFGRNLERARTALLSSIPACGSALVLGDGDGRLLEALLSSQPECQITSVDQSQRMLEIQQHRISKHPLRKNVIWRQQDARDLKEFDHQFDLLVSAFFLDCFTKHELETHLPHWLNTLRPGGLFYVVDFEEPKAGWKRMRGKICLTAMHHFFRWQTNLPNRRLVDINRSLNRCAIEMLVSQSMNHDLICARLYRKLTEQENKISGIN